MSRPTWASSSSCSTTAGLPTANDDTAGLGDWEVDYAKLPHGLGGLAERINGLGMDFGLWIEPEMVSPGTRVWVEHPEWVLHAPGQPLRPSRHQYVLDLSNPCGGGLPHPTV